MRFIIRCLINVLGLWSETKDGMAQLVRDDNGDTYAVKEDDVQDVNPPKYYQVFS